MGGRGFVTKATHVCVLIGCHGDELCLWEDEDLGLGGKEGVIGAVLLHFYYVQTGLVLVQGLQHNHLTSRSRSRAEESRDAQRTGGTGASSYC